MSTHKNAGTGEPGTGADACLGGHVQHSKQGYFRVALDRVPMLIDAAGDAELLAPWLVMRRFAFGPEQSQCEAGAKAIATACGFGRSRASKRLAELVERGLVVPLSTSPRTSRTLYSVGTEPGECAYLPTLFVTPGEPSLAPFLEHPCGAEALRLLLMAYHAVDYAGCGGCDPEMFPFCASEVDAHEDGWWLASEGDPIAPHACTDAFRKIEHLWRSLEWLLERGYLVRLANVYRGRALAYPLFAFGERHREALRVHGVVPDVARSMHRAAQADAAAWEQTLPLTLAAIDGEETGQFVIRGDDEPTVRTLYCPRPIAPTPQNLEGLARMAKLSQMNAI